ncbi:hypothetical protein C8R47DRAFT_1227657 [Mycena vitilis]|nr:hypothetical protein C8R47DRAFT_1227657 [Mycena vitilis]
MFFLVVTTVSVASTLACPPSDDAGYALELQEAGDPKSGEDDSIPEIGCNYFNTNGTCFYVNGTLDTASDLINCPRSLEEVIGAPKSSLGASTVSVPTPASSSTTPASSSRKATPTIDTETASESNSPTLSMAAGPSLAMKAAKSRRNKARPAVIAGIVLSVGCLVGIAVVVSWTRRRRQLALQSNPYPYINDEERLPPGSIAQPDILEKGGTSAVACGNTSPTDEIRAGNEFVDGLRANIRSEEGAPQNETLTERMHRVEAQLGALLAIGLRDSAPPSYRG